MKLVPDQAIKSVYQATKAQMTRKKRRGVGGEDVKELQARIEFLERVFAF